MHSRTVNWGDGQTSADSINLGTTTITDQVVGNTKFSWNPTTKVLTYKHTYLTRDWQRPQDSHRHGPR